jgi:isopenicillin N synthase-like dioxygenase
MAPKTVYSDRVIPTISLANYEERIDDITRELVEAAEKVGFFSLCDHGISSSQVEQMFDSSARFFGLPSEVKATVPWNPQVSLGYAIRVYSLDFMSVLICMRVECWL